MSKKHDYNESSYEPIILFHPEDYDENKIPAIKAIAQVWEDLCRMSPDEGSCAIGLRKEVKL